jgi:O-antigen biosynthesis protein
MISVITSTFNRPDKLKEAIKSVINQTFTDWELIVVSDGPGPKNTFKDDRIKFISIPHFGCDTKTKNEGIKIAKGDYIAFLDDDNTFRPDHLQALFSEITKSKVDLVYGDRWNHGDKTGMGIFHDFEPYLLLRRNYIDTSDVLIKRQVLIDVGGFDERYKKYVDWNLWVRLAKSGYSFKHVPIIITDYYIGKDTKSATKQDEKAFNVPAWDPIDTEIEVNSCLHEVKDPKVAIFSLTYDRLEMTKKCFGSLYKTAGYRFDHFVMDNGSQEAVIDFMKAVRIGTKVIANKENKGISIASNQALDLIGSKYDIIVKVDPDALFLTKGWLAKMVEIWKSNRMMIMSPYIQGLKDNPGGAPRLAYGNIKGEIVGLTKHIGGIVCFADARIYKDFRWDEHQPLHGVQDVEFSTYARMKGYQPAYLENYFCEHCYGTDGQHERYPEYFKRREFETSHAYGEI